MPIKRNWQAGRRRVGKGRRARRSSWREEGRVGGFGRGVRYLTGCGADAEWDLWDSWGSAHETEEIVRQDRKFQGAVSNGISGCVHKRGGSKRVPDYQLPEKRRSNEVLRRRLGSKRLRQGLNVRFFPIFRVPEYSELLIRTDSRSRWNQERGVAELGIFLAANLAPAVEAYCSSAKFESVREDARISRGSCSNQGTGAGAHSDSEFPNALVEGRRCAARPFSPRFNIPSPSE
jgi:hypothetical protein